MRNVETPFQSTALALVVARFVRAVQIWGGNGMTREANAGGRKATGNPRDARHHLLMSARHNRPDIAEDKKMADPKGC